MIHTPGDRKSNVRLCVHACLCVCVCTIRDKQLEHRSGCQTIKNKTKIPPGKIDFYFAYSFRDTVCYLYYCLIRLCFGSLYYCPFCRRQPQTVSYNTRQHACYNVYGTLKRPIYGFTDFSNNKKKPRSIILYVQRVRPS